MVFKLFDRIGEWNPQLFRELKGRLKPRNLTVTAAISLCTQLLVYLFYQTRLPPNFDDFHRYCMGNPPPNWDGYRPYNSNPPSNFCLRDASTHLLQGKLNWELWWLDVFTCLSILAIFALLVGGVYMLIADLSREERRGTLGFIRLSPQSTANILLGKILGVPILLYLLVALGIPFHLYAGFAAKIPLSLTLSFYTVLAISGFFFYSAALLYGLVSAGLGNFQAWVGSGIVLGFLWLMTLIFFSSGDPLTFTPGDWFILFSPTAILPYLVSAAPHSLDTINYGNVKDFAQLAWYDWFLFDRISTAMPFILGNFALWTYWVWQGLERRFHNANATVLSKQNSYWFSGSVIVALLGFVVQQRDWGTYEKHLFENFGLLFVFELVLFVGLMAALNPHRQTLQDWARYRHQNPQSKRSLLKDLIWGEKSPATLAIALNLIVTSSTILAGILLLPLKEFRTPAMLGLFLTGSTILIYASLAQGMLMMKVAKRGVWATATVTTMILLPLLCFALFQIEPTAGAWLWLLSAVPVFATKHIAHTTVLWTLLGQWTAIALINLQLTRQLRQAGQSATKALEAKNQASYAMN